VQERGEPCVLVLLCDSAHAIQRTWRALPGSVSETRFVDLLLFPGVTMGGVGRARRG
jgi:hypothetical protein